MIQAKSPGKLFEQVYKIVRQIPKGKVTTYGVIARKLGTRDSRKVGYALHANPDPETPCHRVVNKDGKLADSYAKNKKKNYLPKELFLLQKKLWIWKNVFGNSFSLRFTNILVVTLQFVVKLINAKRFSSPLYLSGTFFCFDRNSEKLV